MASRKNMVTQVGYFTAFFMVISCIFSKEFVESKRIPMVKNTEWGKNKGTVKTIKSEDGDVIDCVDIYKQLAFDHPQLKHHRLEMSPSFYPKGSKPINSQEKIIQSWQKTGQCPQGTVPIRRSPKQDYHYRATPLNPHPTQLNLRFTKAPNHEYAQASQMENNYGAYAKINVWNPTTMTGKEFSDAQIWVVSGTPGEGTMNSVEAGWMVNPELYRDNQTRLFIYWTRDNYQTTGCYNLDCPGFVQTSQKIVLGGPISPISSYEGQQYEISVTIYQTMVSKSWWLIVQDEVVGYWPGSILPGLANFSSYVAWGGEVYSENSSGYTSTQMGSGHFPFEGIGKASYFRNIAVMDQSGTLRDPEKLENYASSPSCYDVMVESKSDDYGTNFCFGGPGCSA